MDDQRDFPTPDLAQLVGSRLCHDLVNPISAISNGLELLSLSGAAPSPELELISDAVRDALARIRFFRVAFGAARPGEAISQREARQVLGDLYGQGRLSVNWQGSGELSRADAKRSFLMINCVESSMPLGGEISVTPSQGGCHLSAKGPRLVIEPEVWAQLDTTMGDASPPAAKVQFSLLRQEADLNGLILDHDISEEAGTISLSLRPL